MINIRGSFRSQCFYFRYLRKLSLSSSNCCKNGCSTSSRNLINGQALISNEGFCTPHINFYSTSTAAPDLEELVDANVFEKVCEETLESLTEFFEELIERNDTLKNADVSYSSGVLTINLGNNFGTYVINRQSPNRQIWLSSPISGPKRYDYVVNGKYWIYKHDMVPLHKLLQDEISSILGENVDFSTCLYSKT